LGNVKEDLLLGLWFAHPEYLIVVAWRNLGIILGKIIYPKKLEEVNFKIMVTFGRKE